MYALRKAMLRKHVSYQYFRAYPPRETLLRKQNLLNKEAKMFPNKIKNIFGAETMFPCICFHAYMYVFWLLTCFQPEKALSQQRVQHPMNCPCQKYDGLDFNFPPFRKANELFGLFGAPPTLEATLHYVNV